MTTRLFFLTKSLFLIFDLAGRKHKRTFPIKGGLQCSDSRNSGLPDGIFGGLWNEKMLVFLWSIEIYYGHLGYCMAIWYVAPMAIWYIVWPSGILYGHLVIK
jgi:hypothetical protein